MHPAEHSRTAYNDKLEVFAQQILRSGSSSLILSAVLVGQSRLMSVLAPKAQLQSRLGQRPRIRNEINRTQR